MKGQRDRLRRLLLTLATGSFLGFVVLIVLAFSPSPALAEDRTARLVYVAQSGNSALDQHVTQLLSESLGDNTTLRPISAGQVSVTQSAPIVTIGPTAFSQIRQANRDAPILAMLVERPLMKDYLERDPGRISAIYYDVPLIRQALIGKAVLPYASKVSIIATTESVALYEPVIDSLRAFGLEARIFLVDSQHDLIPTLNRALSFGDFLLAGPDDHVYNPRTIKHILLTAYRRTRIVIGPSQAYVKAGSLASGYAPFTVMAEMAANYLDQFFETGQFPEARYPDEYRVEMNLQVARSLNIPVPDRKAIEDFVNRTLEQPEGEME